MKILNSNTSVICPSNDGESVIIGDISSRLSFDTRISKQQWGAELSFEPEKTFNNLKENVIIIEIPGIEMENTLRKKHNLFIIDHHRYEKIDRSNPESSLEQFSKLLGYQLNRFEMGVALNDRGFIPLLKDKGYTGEEIKNIRRFDLIAQGYKSDEFQRMEKEYLKGRIYDRFYIIETDSSKTSYFSDLHYFTNEREGRNFDLFVIVTENINLVKFLTFTGTPATAILMHDKFGGFFGGDKNVSMFWGKLFNPPESKEKILSVIQCS